MRASSGAARRCPAMAARLFWGYHGPMSLTGKQRRHLRALGHPLAPIVHIGKDGLTQAIGRAVTQALLDHELIKVKLGPYAELERDDAAEQLAQMTDSHVAQILGKTILL